MSPADRVVLRHMVDAVESTQRATSSGMALRNHDRVGKALDLLRAGHDPFIEREMENAYRERTHAEALRLVGDAHDERSRRHGRKL